MFVSCGVCGVCVCVRVVGVCVVWCTNLNSHSRSSHAAGRVVFGPVTESVNLVTLTIVVKSLSKNTFRKD